jgi:hypothetical protein
MGCGGPVFVFSPEPFTIPYAVLYAHIICSCVLAAVSVLLTLCWRKVGCCCRVKCELEENPIGDIPVKGGSAAAVAMALGGAGFGTMSCPKCGAVLPGDAQFCLKCGTKIHEDQPAESTKESEPPPKQTPCGTPTEP